MPIIGSKNLELFAMVEIYGLWENRENWLFFNTDCYSQCELAVALTGMLLSSITLQPAQNLFSNEQLLNLII